MIWNPEFRKNIQLELNPVKLVLMPVVIGMMFAVVYLSVDNKAPAAPPLQLAALILFAALVFVWGTKMAVESLISEFNDRTWDSQRMTAIGPWSLAWGKLLGSSLFAWYGGLFCLLVFAASTAAIPAAEGQRMLKMLLFSIFAGSCIQTTMLASILTEFAKKREAAKMRVSSYSIVALLLLMQVSSFAAAAYNVQETAHWFGMDLHPFDIMLYSSLFFCLWGIVGMYRAMRKELQFESRPTVWAIFLISMMIYCAGFIPPDATLSFADRLLICSWISFAIAVISFYIMLLTEPKHLVDFRLIRSRAQQKNWAGLMTKIPAWLISFLLAAMLCAVMLIFNAAGLADLNKEQDFFIQFSPLALLLFCLRDIGIVLYVNFSSTKKNRDVTALFYIAILYMLVPSLLQIAEAKVLLPWFVPFIESNFINTILPVAVQAGFVLTLAWRKMR
ncbi:hypothetical protein GCAAIG_13230 [Candidatus Electronema halotolerans]